MNDKPTRRVYLDDVLIAEIYSFGVGTASTKDKYLRGNFVVSYGESTTAYITFEDTDERIEGVMWRGFDTDGVESWWFVSGETVKT